MGPKEIMYKFDYSVAASIYFDDGESEPQFACVDPIGYFPSREKACEVARNLACLYLKTNIAASYCEAHGGSDGMCFDVVYRCRNCIDSYELSATGKYEEWHDEECHDRWKVV